MEKKMEHETGTVVVLGFYRVITARSGECGPCGAQAVTTEQTIVQLLAQSKRRASRCFGFGW